MRLSGGLHLCLFIFYSPALSPSLDWSPSSSFPLYLSHTLPLSHRPPRPSRSSISVFPMETPPYGGGIGGKLRRKPLQKVAATPYDRPAASVAGIREPEEGSWLGRLVTPASQFISNSVSRLFCSVLAKPLSATRIQGVPVIGWRPESVFLEFSHSSSFSSWLASGGCFFGGLVPFFVYFEFIKKIVLFSDRLVWWWLGV